MSLVNYKDRCEVSMRPASEDDTLYLIDKNGGHILLQVSRVCSSLDDERHTHFCSPTSGPGPAQSQCPIHVCCMTE